MSRALWIKLNQIIQTDNQVKIHISFETLGNEV